MCGLVGIFGQNITPNLVRTFSELLVCDVVRGPHSTGVALISENGKNNPKIIKDVYLPVDLLTSIEYIKVMKKRLKLMMGHNRSATKGEVNKENSHPFKKGHITLAHNGTIHNWVEETARNIKSDSELLTVLIAEKGIKKTWEDISDYSAATITYWDSKKKTFNIIADGQREFHYVFTEKRDAIIWASELKMLQWIISRRHIRTYKDGKSEYWHPKENYLQTYTIEKGKIIETLTNIPKKKKHYQNVSSIYSQQKENKNDTLRLEKQDNPWNYYESDYYSPLTKDEMTEKEFMENSDNHSCIFCNENLESEYNKVYSIEKGIVVCKTCVEIARENGQQITKEMLI